ncbi:MAG: IS66 family transposase [Sphingomonadaceae bacterium]|nr:IS66 family transposase [Sphingomonadaceae bacterium]
MTPPLDLSGLNEAGKDALILAQAQTIALLTEQYSAEIAALHARVTELEAKLNVPPKTPNNSSQPPSQGQKANEESTAKGRRKSHKGAHRPLHPSPTSRRDVVAGQCEHCGTDVSGQSQLVCEAYDHIEIPDIKPDVTRVSLMGGVCPCCAGQFKAAAPADMPRGSPFGPNLRALAIYLRFTQAISFQRLARLLSDMLGLAISEGALVNILDAAKAAFGAAQSTIRNRLLAGTILESDETGLRVGKKNWWLWVFHHGDSAVFVAEPSRAKTVVGDFLGEVRPDYWLSDRYGGQLGWAAKDNQVCLAHLIRDAQYAIENGDGIFAPGLRHLFGRACRIGQRRDRLTDATLKSYERRLDQRLDELLDLKPTHKTGIKLQKSIKTCRRFLWTFVTHRGLEPTNNGSERALRPCAIFRKVTNGFRTPWGARLYADVRSVLETARRRQIGVLDAIRLTLAYQILPLAP